MQLILLMVTLVIYQKEALAICAYYPGVYDGSSYTAISTGGVRSGYNSYGQYGTFTCQTTSGHSYWSPDTSYVAASAAAPPPPPPPANTYFSVINNTSETVNCYDNGVSIGPYSSSTCYTPTRVGLTQLPDFQNPSYYDTYRLSYYNGYTETTAIYGRNGPGMSYQSYDVPPSGQVVVDQYTRSCTQPYPVQPGCPVTTCNAPWGGTVANGASITAYSTNVAPYGSSCQPQTRTCSSGALSGSYTAQSCYVAAPANCTATSLNWGAANFCAKTTTTASHGAVQALTNGTAGATGSATATCSNGAWALSATSCSPSIAAPTSLSATDGTVNGKITVTWAAVSGASGYDLQYRKQGNATWTAVAGAASGWQLTTTDESTYEFQVRGTNATGAGTWSATETGFIRKNIDPQFVSQTGIPAKIGVGQSFTFSQIWQNNGAETWTGGAHGTGPYNPADTSVWGQGVTAFVGSTVTGASTTTSITVTAPTAPGTYPLQRIFQKSGVAYGAPSTAVDVVVVGAPTCTAVTPNVTSTYNPNGTITVTLQGASSVESATVKAWGSIGSVDDIREYTMNLAGSTWTASIPVVNHYATGETQININAFVANSLFTPVACASTSVAFQQLPVPNVTLIPVLGTSTEIPNPGFIAKRANGEFAKAVIDLGAFNTLRAKIELLSPDLTVAVGPAQNNVSAGTPTVLQVDDTIKGSDKPAWRSVLVTVRVSYADPDAAAQGKESRIPVLVTVPPVPMQVTAAGTQGLPVGVNARVHSAGDYSNITHGDFVGALRLQDGTVVRDFEATGADGSWAATGLDYGQLYDKKLVAVARVVPPSYVTLLEPMEFLSTPFMLPVQAPATIAATDGTREDDVQVQWAAPATGEGVRYRLYRDDVEISPAGGVSASEYLDVPPLRGKEYTYRVKTLINTVTSDNQAQDTGYMPACRAMRLIGAGVNADMSAINGMIERWGCLTESVATSSFNGSPAQDTAISGEGNYRSFSVPIPSGLADGAHVMTLRLQSKEVQNHADRVYDIPFTLNKAAITVKSLSILYNGMPAAEGVEANSIGRFGIKMEGGSGIGFAEETPQ